MPSSHLDAFQSLKLGQISPQGWLRDQLEIQSAGLSSWLADNWPDIAQSKWIGGQAEGWERGPYWLDGAVPLAFLIDDEAMKARCQRWIDAILERQHPDGWLGEKHDVNASSGEHKLDPWPLALVFKAFISWHEATEDERIVPAMTRAFRRIDTLLDEKPLASWAKMRWPELALGAQWLYGETGEDWLLPLVEKMAHQGYDWRAHFADFADTYPGKQSKWTLETHVVNHAMALKEPAVRARGGEENEAQQAQNYIALLDQFHGQATGVFSGDECLAGTSPSQGTELCAVVEYLFSLEELIQSFARPEWADRLESIAFNALPATFTHDMNAHQYDQQVNQVLCSHAKRDWVSNGDASNLFGLEPNFGCCTANMHQGWPKFANRLWMTNAQDDLVAIAFAPCEVEIDGFKITESTDYPFREIVTFSISTEAACERGLQFHIPAWAQNVTLKINDEDAKPVAANSFHREQRAWQNGDTIQLHLPMPLRAQTRPNGAVSIWRGPLMFGLKIEEEFQHLKGELPVADWEVHPRSPWNLALEGSLKDWTVQEKEIAKHPFDPSRAPVEIKAAGCRLESWQLQNNSAAQPPQSPVETSVAPQEITLIPYGSTHLRIGEFPVTSDFRM